MAGHHHRRAGSLATATRRANFFEGYGKLGGDVGLVADEIFGFADVGAQVEEGWTTRRFGRVGFRPFFAAGRASDVFPVAFADGEAAGVFDEGFAALL